MAGLMVDLQLLRHFEAQLDPLHPEAGTVPVQVLGYGEISTVFAIDGQELAYKRMPIFQSSAEIDAYEAIYDRYNQLLQEDVGIALPRYGRARVPGRQGVDVLYLVQQRLPAGSIGNQALHWLDAQGALRLVEAVLGELAKVWEFNRGQDQMQLGIDGQISNWALADFDPSAPHLPDDLRLVYVDTSTPLFRIDGQEQLDAELFLRSAPSFLAWLLRWLFLKDVVGRYYDFHAVIVDLIANFYKEQQAELIPDLVQLANDFLSRQVGELDIAPITRKEVEAYYRQDAFIWRLYQGARRLDRWLHTRLLHKPYPYILPGPVQR
ncbi:MAG: hypothetical protein GXP37_03650 [Chloroflexi bacterium]|nr:hypothetical protein [Chloroflexota bacterium]